MICPKCGFQQPDDIYCVFCGVNIETYLKQKKRRRYKGGLLVVLLGIVGLSVAYYIFSSHQAGVSRRAEEQGSREHLARSTSESRPGLESGKPYGERQSLGSGGTERPYEARSRGESHEVGGTEYERATGDEAGLKAPPEQDKGQRLLDDSLEGEATASEWFEKGKALDDDSEAEIQCYQRAIEMDVTFAPAYYRLGAIYYRQANYDLADQEFASFLEYASDAEKEIYDLYEYYSFADLQRLSKSLEEEAPAEEEEVAAQEEGEAEEGGKEPGGKTESEAEQTSSETTDQKANEEVMTTVNFLPVEGHILVPVMLNDSRLARVLVDTGAGITILSRDLAKALGLEMRSGHSITLRTIAMDVEGQLARLDSIQVGEFTRRNFPVAVTDLPLGEESRFDGILGMDFMNDYKIQIDNENRKIVLSPKSE